MTLNVTFAVIFGLSLIWAIRRGVGAYLFAFIAVMFGISIGNTALGSSMFAGITNAMGAFGAALLSAFNGAVN